MPSRKKQNLNCFVTALLAMTSYFCALTILSVFLLEPVAIAKGYMAPQHYFIAISKGYSNLNGYIQIPAGGNPGTSSIKRPTFSELNIKHSTMSQIDLNVKWKRFGFYGSYQYNKPNGTSRLKTDLVSHSIFIPAGTIINTDTKFDIYRLGVFYDIFFHNNSFILHPEFETTALDFSYQFKTALASSSRHFRTITPRIGIGGEYLLSHNIALNFDAMTSIPSVTNFSLQTVSTGIEVKIYQSSDIKTTIFGKLLYRRLDFEDHQKLPNHIRVENYPAIVIGIRLLAQ